ncbi:MAG: hypothetical protein IPM42_14525 [Saprospiraceae bacterium]|nr:hypothetical protein [Saprospiraceae bacterium]
MLIKIIYFITFFLSIILFLSFMGLSLDHWLHPFKKNSEAVILLLSGILTIIGMWYSLKYGYNTDHISKGIFQLLGSWLLTAIFLTIGLVFFNGSSK